MKAISYYAVVASGKNLTEVLVTRQNGISTQSATGVVFKSMREAERELERKNTNLSVVKQ